MPLMGLTPVVSSDENGKSRSRSLPTPLENDFFRWKHLAEVSLHAPEKEELTLSRQIRKVTQQGGFRLKYFGIGKSINSSSRLIHPSSPFALVVLVISVVLQLYSSLVSAFLVGFFWHVDLCTTTPPTLYMDLVVDCFFLAEIAITFFTGAYIHGEYEDRMSFVANHYLHSGFLFDCAKLS